MLDRQARRTGIRSVSLQQHPHPVAGRYCIIEVNGRPVFCKGGNWVPPDMIPSRVTRERLAALVELACAANFNFLRVWGGGVYAGNDLLDLCDVAGVLVWHDLPFACSKYPGDDPAFLAEVRTEVAWAVREAARHPSLIVWCGNNEQEWGAWEWGYDRMGKSLPDYALYHHVIPVIMQQEDGTRLYWPSSPYSPEHRPPNDRLWGTSIPGAWACPGSTAPTSGPTAASSIGCPNEGGFLGASSPATLNQFLPETERYLRSPSWEHHDNSVNAWDPVIPITYQAVRDWLGREPKEMRLEEYAVASGLLQAEALAEYIANYRRRMFSSASAVFWMYADSWPVTHGWTSSTTTCARSSPTTRCDGRSHRLRWWSPKRQGKSASSASTTRRRTGTAAPLRHLFASGRVCAGRDTTSHAAGRHLHAPGPDRRCGLGQRGARTCGGLCPTAGGGWPHRLPASAVPEPVQGPGPGASSSDHVACRRQHHVAR